MFIESLLARRMRSECAKRISVNRTAPGSSPIPFPGKPCAAYVHIPFCEQLCPYCSFNRVLFEPDLAARYFSSLTAEIESYLDLGFTFNSLYVGGGTPTVMPRQLAGVITFVRKAFPSIEVSVETNPEHLSRETVSILKDAGVNRLSVGIQTFDDGLLAEIGRLQRCGSGRESREKLARVAGVFDTVNVDMIFNLPGQSDQMLEADVAVVNDLPVDQVTFYPRMPSRAAARALPPGRMDNIDLRAEARFFRTIAGSLSAEYKPVSAWCFSRKKGMIDEYIVHNRDYAGLGAGSFGYLDGTLYSNAFSLQRYMDMVASGSLPVAGSRRYSPRERASYDFLMGLFGLSLDAAALQAKYGRGVWLLLWKELGFLACTGAVTFGNGRLAVTPRGRYYLVALMREFFKAVTGLREDCVAADIRAGAG